MLFLEPFVRVEGAGFVQSVSNWMLGVIVKSGRVVEANFIHTNIDGLRLSVKSKG